MQGVVDAIFQRIHEQGCLQKQDLRGLRLLFRHEIEGCMIILDHAERLVTRYVPTQGMYGPEFFTVVSGQPRKAGLPPKAYVVMPSSNYCMCPYFALGRGKSCKHILACRLCTALPGLSVKTIADKEQYEDTLVRSFRDLETGIEGRSIIETSAE